MRFKGLNKNIALQYLLCVKFFQRADRSSRAAEAAAARPVRPPEVVVATRYGTDSKHNVLREPKRRRNQPAD